VAAVYIYESALLQRHNEQRQQNHLRTGSLCRALFRARLRARHPERPPPRTACEHARGVSANPEVFVEPTHDASA